MHESKFTWNEVFRTIFALIGVMSCILFGVIAVQKAGRLQKLYEQYALECRTICSPVGSTFVRLDENNNCICETTMKREFREKP